MREKTPEKNIAKGLNGSERDLTKYATFDPSCMSEAQRDWVIRNEYNPPRENTLQWREYLALGNEENPGASAKTIAELWQENADQMEKQAWAKHSEPDFSKLTNEQQAWLTRSGGELPHRGTNDWNEFILLGKPILTPLADAGGNTRKTTQTLKVRRAVGTKKLKRAA